MVGWQTQGSRAIALFNGWHITPKRAGTPIRRDTNHLDQGIFLVDAATGSRRLACLSESSNGGSQWRQSRYALAEDFAAARNHRANGRVLGWMEAGADTVP